MADTEIDVCFNKIMTSDVLFYGDAFKEDCKTFCNKRNITYLPSGNNANVCYKLDGGEFKKKGIEESQRVEVTDKIFDNSILDKFRRHHVLFVYRNNKIAGIVHFCDYNRDSVFLNIYPLLLQFERELRKLLISHGLRNEDMIEFFKNHSGKEHYPEKFEHYTSEKIQKGMKELEPFQAFDLKDLIGLVNSKDILRMSENICDLRNHIMHVKNIVKHKNYEISSLIYSFESFDRFFRLIRNLGPEIERVSKAILPLKEEEEVTKLKKAGLFRHISG